MAWLWCQWGYLDLWGWLIWGLEDPESIQVDPSAYLICLISYIFCWSYLTRFLPFGFSYPGTQLWLGWQTWAVKVPCYANGLVVPPLIHSGAGECKGCNLYGQLLCGMLQVPGAVQTLPTHFLAAHGRSTGAYNIPVTTQWLGQRLYYGLL